MSRLDDIFRSIRDARRTILMPFITAGDPSLQVTIELIRRFAELGSPIVEVGFPFSDPIADGPVIQASYARALQRGLRTQDIFFALREMEVSPDRAVVAMVSYALIHRHGLQAFVAAARNSYISGLIAPDLPHEEADLLRACCREADISLIPLITPTTSPVRAEQIVRHASGFIYLVSVTGITGARTELPWEVVDRIRWLRTQTPLPICVGFGVSRPEQVAMLAPIADGVIVGSALVRELASASNETTAIRNAVSCVRELSSGLSPSVA